MKRGIAAALAALMAMLCWNGTALAAAEEQNVTVLFTNGLHSSVLPRETEPGEELAEVGGFARIKTAADRVKEERSAVVMVDGGDFSVGTLFQALYATDGAELRLMGAMGYDAVTLGERELTLGAEGLSAMLQAAVDSGETLPKVVQANLAYPAEGGLAEAAERAGLAESMLVEKNGVQIGIFGILGEEALDDGTGWTAEDAAQTAQDQAEALRAQGAELVICLFHGTDETSTDGAEALAEAAPELDVIIDGHRGALETPLTVGDTIICAAGENGASLGRLDLRKSGERWRMTGHELIEIDGALRNDSQINQMASVFRQRINSTYLAQFGYEYDTALTECGFDFAPAARLGESYREEPLGSLVADAYRYAVGQATGAMPDVAIASAAEIQGSLREGAVTVADAFQVCPEGVGLDGTLGEPLALLYLTGRELKAVCELDASFAIDQPDSQLFLSGMTFAFHPGRMILDRVIRTGLTRDGGSVEELEDDRLYSVACSLDTARQLEERAEKSMGILSIAPKDAGGAELTDWSGSVVMRQEGGELKAWLALASYLESFGEEGVPTRYEALEGRKLREAGGSILERPGLTTWLAIALAAMVVAAAGILAYRIATRRRRRAKGKR